MQASQHACSSINDADHGACYSERSVDYNTDRIIEKMHILACAKYRISRPNVSFAIGTQHILIL